MPTGTHHYDAITGLKAVVESLALADDAGQALPAGRVYAQELLTARETLVKPPCVIVSKAPMPEAVDLEDLDTDVTGYPCLVGVIFPADQDPTLREAPARWRQACEEVFSHKADVESDHRLAALADALGVELKWTDWHPLDAVDLERFHQDGLIVNGAVVIVYVWKPR